jgi:hypothetical protein
MYKTKLVLLALCFACVGVAVAAPSASAIDPRYTRFAGCPDRPELVSCIRADTPAGNIRMGNTNVPITQTVTLSGGVAPINFGVPNPLYYNAQGGLQGNPLEVPGGLAGLTGISELILNLITFGANRVFAQAQLVDEPRLNFSTFDLHLPIKVNLLNPFLRPGCSIGSASSPIVLTLIIGTTSPPPPATPISGHVFTTSGSDPADPNILLLGNIKHVDNSFSVPGASTCDLFGLGLISGLINSRVGLPSAAGRNEAIFDRTDIRLVNHDFVYP